MSGKPIWENRFRGLVKSIDSHRDANHTKLASMAVNAAGNETNTPEYWRELGKYEFLETLKNVCRLWEQGNWF